MAELEPFEGRDVSALAVIIRNTGDGLSQAMAVEPAESRIGQHRTVTLDVELEKVRYDPVKDTGGLRRVEIWRAEGATFIDRRLVASALDSMQERIEASQGVRRLPLDDGADGADEGLPGAEEAARAMPGQDPVPVGW